MLFDPTAVTSNQGHRLRVVHTHAHIHSLSILGLKGPSIVSMPSSTGTVPRKRHLDDCIVTRTKGLRLALHHLVKELLYRFCGVNELLEVLVEVGQILFSLFVVRNELRLALQ
jgi:hypothetical protein